MKTIKTIKTVIGSIFVFVVLLLIAGLWYVYSGTYDVSAEAPDNPVVSWLVSTTRKHSIESRATGVGAPPNLSDSKRIRAGASLYREDCAVCHGSPGAYPSETGEGLDPHPPDLARAGAHADARELYWVIRHGVKMTGMPSWAHVYDAQQVWSLVAFLKQALPTLSPAQYREMTAVGSASQGEKPASRNAARSPPR